MDKDTLAVDGGIRAIEGFEGRGDSKIGDEEFLEMADTWGYSSATIDKIREAIADADLDGGPFLIRYKSGSKVARMEHEVSQLFNVKNVLAVSNGTAALHTAYVAADINEGDEVIVPGYTFMATAMAAVVARGIPIWCDIDESMTIAPAELEKRITPHTKAVVPVHMNGCVCNMDAVMEVARKHNLTVIEDCAQACGASFRGCRTGTIGNLGCFSISSYKTTGGGEGGLVITDDDALFSRAQQWAEGGGLWRPDRCAPARWKGELFPGLNYRLSELEGSVDLVQIRKVDSQLHRWRANKRCILRALPVYHELRPQVIHDINGEMGHHIGFFPESTAESDRVVAALRAEGVGCHTRGQNAVGDWHAYHSMQPILEKMPATSDGWPWNHPHADEVEYSLDACPRTADLVDRQVRVSIDQWWTERDCKQVVAALVKVFDALYTRDPSCENWLAAVTQTE